MHITLQEMTLNFLMKLKTLTNQETALICWQSAILMLKVWTPKAAQNLTLRLVQLFQEQVTSMQSSQEMFMLAKQLLLTTLT